MTAAPSLSVCLTIMFLLVFSSLSLGIKFYLPFVGFMTGFCCYISFKLSSFNHLGIGRRISSRPISAVSVTSLLGATVLFSPHENATILVFTSFSVVPLVILIVFVCRFSLLFSSGAVALLVWIIFSVLLSYYRLFHFIRPFFLQMIDERWSSSILRKAISEHQMGMESATFWWPVRRPNHWVAKIHMVS